MSNGPEFFQTPMGKRYYESTMPALVKAIEHLNDNLEKIGPILMMMANADGFEEIDDDTESDLGGGDPDDLAASISKTPEEK